MNQPRCVEDNPVTIIPRGLVVQALLHDPLHIVPLHDLIYLYGRGSFLLDLLHLLLDLLESLVSRDLPNFHQSLRIQKYWLFYRRGCEWVFTLQETLLGQPQVFDNTGAFLPVRLMNIILPLVKGDDLGLGVAKADVF